MMIYETNSLSGADTNSPRGSEIPIHANLDTDRHAATRFGWFACLDPTTADITTKDTPCVGNTDVRV